MKRAFKESFQKELSLLKERAALFAQETPGVADRLGGLLEENLDPSIAGLLEGSAFLAARVQLNIDQQFRTFSEELLNQICPEITAPLPAAILLEGTPPGKAADLAEGQRLEVNDLVDASFSDATRRITCRFRLTEPLTFWPVELTDTAYHNGPTALASLGCDGLVNRGEKLPKTAAGLVVSLRRTDGGPISGLKAETLPIHFAGPEDSATALYEQIFGNTFRLSMRWVDKSGETILRRLPVDVIEQIGFEDEHPLFGRDERLFPGFSKLIEYFAFPRKFLGMRLARLSEFLRYVTDNSMVQLIFEFDKPNAHLGAQFEPEHLRLFCVPAVNLFEDTAKPITLDKKHHKFIITPNRTPLTNFEVHRITSVRAQYENRHDRIEVLPLYAIPTGTQDPRQALYYTAEKTRRRLSRKESRTGGTQFRYEGTETSITLYEPPDKDPANLLFVKTLCSNRHLPEILNIADAVFHLVEDHAVTLHRVAGPTPPREAIAELEAEGPHRMRSGDNYWRLISILSLSQRGFLGPDGTGNVDALRETLRLFSDVSDKVNIARINALFALNARAITRTIQRHDGYFPARGMEISIIFDDDIIGDSNIIAFSAIIDRFLADYTSINSFTQCVAKNRKGQVLKSWPPRSGTGPLTGFSRITHQSTVSPNVSPKTARARS